MISMTGARVRRMRERLGEGQWQFWSRLGVTQSGGSRYETGRRIPRPIQILLAVACGTERQMLAMVRRLRRHRGTRAPGRFVRGVQ